jgi:hypothetical protein
MGMNGKRGYGVAIPMKAFSLEDPPQLAAGIFTSLVILSVKLAVFENTAT